MDSVGKYSPSNSPWLLVSGIKEPRFTIVVEQNILCDATSFVHGLFLLVSSYYVFHLRYPDKSKLVLLFLQDYIFGRPDMYEKRKAKYLATASDIKKYL